MKSALSIGAIGEVSYEPVSDRSKGFLSDMHTSISAIADALSSVAAGHREGSRLSIRLPIADNVSIPLASCVSVPWKDGAVLSCEAFIPVGRRGLGGIMYFGANASSRQTSHSILIEEWKLLDCLTGAPRTYREEPRGFCFESLECPSHEDIHQLMSLYAASYQRYMTDFSPGSIRMMIADNEVSLARNGEGTIVAVTQAEAVSVGIGGMDWILIELSDTATLPEYRSIGLSQLCKLRLVNARRSETAIIYTESRANHAGVLRSNWNVGMESVGRLEAHCLMSSHAEEVPQIGGYANLFVFALQ